MSGGRCAGCYSLLPHPNRNGEWGIIYNSSITSKGRINFTLGHELGHYLLHRHLSPEGFRCSSCDMLDWKSEHGQIEAQANTFASFLLMPLDDFGEQIRSQEITMALMRHLSDRYEVSITAAILKWLGITDKPAMIVVSKDGFIDWAWGSKRLFKSGIYYRARQETVPLPELSLAARRDPSIDAEIGFVHPKGVWVGNEEVNEMTGERFLSGCRVLPGGGSSPHARGTPRQARLRSHMGRFIPACAGNASFQASTSWSTTVHPRMRGERTYYVRDVAGNTGSSPHARGTPQIEGAHLETWRFIPACAGNANSHGSNRNQRSVHPRMRGERFKSPADAMEATGSSPHARGTPFLPVFH